jgi:hypothetical protein
MSSRPCQTPYSPRELVFGVYVAATLWLAAAALLVGLAAWSLGPRLAA